MASLLAQIGISVVKKAISVLGPATIAKQAIKNPNATRKVAEMVIKNMIKK